MEDILKRIRSTRKRKSLTAKDIAQEIGISRSFYTLIENGKRRLTVDMLVKIARALKVSISELFGEAAGTQVKTFRHLRPINTPELRRQLTPLLGDQTAEAVDCLRLWFESPEGLRRALKAFNESESGNAGAS